MDVSKRYAEEDCTIDSDDEFGPQLNRRIARNEGRRKDYRFSANRPGTGNTVMMVAPSSSPMPAKGSATPRAAATMIVAHARITRQANASPPSDC
jgi:hypothetical protein